MFSRFIDYIIEIRKQPEWVKSRDPIQDHTDHETEVIDDYYEQDNDHDIAGATFGIEYVGANGIKSERDISVIRCIEQNGNVSLIAHCFVRERVRQFRLDRIISVYNENGEILEPQKFFSYYNLNYISNTPTTPVAGQLLIKRMKDEARILVALARIDGKFCNNELDNIIIYSVKKLEDQGEIQTDEDINIYRNYLSKLYPSKTVLEGCFRRLRNYTSLGKEQFISMCVQIMNSDNIQHPKEFDMILNIREELDI